MKISSLIRPFTFKGNKIYSHSLIKIILLSYKKSCKTLKYSFKVWKSFFYFKNVNKSSKIKQSNKRLNIEIELRKIWNFVYYFFYTTFSYAFSLVRLILSHFLKIVQLFFKINGFHIVLELFSCLVYYQIGVLF